MNHPEFMFDESWASQVMWQPDLCNVSRLTAENVLRNYASSPAIVFKTLGNGSPWGIPNRVEAVGQTTEWGHGVAGYLKGPGLGSVEGLIKAVDKRWGAGVYLVRFGGYANVDATLKVTINSSQEKPFRRQPVAENDCWIVTDGSNPIAAIDAWGVPDEEALSKRFDEVRETLQENAFKLPIWAREESADVGRQVLIPLNTGLVLPLTLTKPEELDDADLLLKPVAFPVFFLEDCPEEIKDERAELKGGEWVGYEVGEESEDELEVFDCRSESFAGDPGSIVAGDPPGPQDWELRRAVLSFPEEARGLGEADSSPLKKGELVWLRSGGKGPYTVIGVSSEKAKFRARLIDGAKNERVGVTVDEPVLIVADSWGERWLFAASELTTQRPVGLLERGLKTARGAAAWCWERRELVLWASVAAAAWKFLSV